MQNQSCDLRILLAGVALCAFALIGCADSTDTDDDVYPSRPIKIVVPFGAGGGTDIYARIFKQAIDELELLPQPVVIINQGGAGATIGSRRVKDAEPDGYTVLILHDAILTAKLSGTVNYGPEVFEPIAGTGEVGMVIAVPEDAPYQNLSDLLDAAAAQPGELAFGANIGALTHFAGLQLEQQQEGAKFRFAQIGGGADRFANLKAGHIAVTGFSIEEFVRFRTDGLRGLAYFGAERHPAADDVPTAREQGHDIISSNTFYWWFPRDTPQDRVDAFADVLEKAVRSEQVQEKMKEIHCQPIFIRGKQLQQRLDEGLVRLSQVAPREIVTLPHLPPILASMAALLGIGVLVTGRRRRAGPVEIPSTERRRLDLAAGVLLATIAYVGVLVSGRMDFRIATAGYVLVAGGLLAGRNRLRWAAVAVVAVAMGWGTHAIFTHVFVVDLP